MRKPLSRTSLRRLPRRDFIITTAAITGLGVLAGCVRNDDDIAPAEDGDLDAIAALIAVLFPHQGIAAPTYQNIAETVQETLAARDDWPVIRSEGEAVLRVNGDKEPLVEKDRAAQVEALKETAFFKIVYQTGLIEFYSHPDVWRHIGYPGASAQDGGYLHRGFDDIDWLPEDAQ